MKKATFYITLFVTVGLFSCNMPKATKLMVSNLRIIERKVNRDTTLNLNEVEPAINFLEKATGIASQSDGNFIGRYQPTKTDYLRWSKWFKENRSKIYLMK
jgi:hypothetical protein